jgi:hypothetical protein
LNLIHRRFTSATISASPPGITFIGTRLAGKRLELACELVPNVGVAALLTNPTSHDAWEELRDLQNTTKTIGQQLLGASPASDHEFEAAFASILQHRAGVLLISSDPFLFQASDQLIALAARHRIQPSIHLGIRGLAHAARPRRRGDRMSGCLAAIAHSRLWGTQWPWQRSSNMSAVEGKPAAPSRCRDFSI